MSVRAAQGTLERTPAMQGRAALSGSCIRTSWTSGGIGRESTTCRGLGEQTFSWQVRHLGVTDALYLANPSDPGTPIVSVWQSGQQVRSVETVGDDIDVHLLAMLTSQVSFPPN